jgi:glycosyltransferase involved in cell wall biosynthesis
VSALKIVALPRDPNPYQGLLYGPMREHGASVRYGGELTRSRTVNLLALPLELFACRLRGYSVFHIHWTFGFKWPGSRRFSGVRRAGRLWFALVLRIARCLGFRVVWTAHNLLPHSPVFDDDVKARRTLVGAADLVIAHSRDAIADVTRLTGHPRAARVIPHGPMLAPGIGELTPTADVPARTILFFGRIDPYKGVEDLLEASGQPSAPLRFVIAGECRDAPLRERLIAVARTLPNVELRLGHVPEDDIAPLFEAADAIVFPFRMVTTSGSVRLAMASGRPVIVPDLPAFADVPAHALIRYRPGLPGLRKVLVDVSELSAEARRAIGTAGQAHSTSPQWSEIATWTELAISELGSRSARRHGNSRFRAQSDHGL